MNDIIICDTREKGNKKILEYFDKVGQNYIISKLDAGDYMIYKNYKTIIDKKDGLLELSGNLCHTSEHERVKREVARSRELGCENFIFLIQDSKIKSLEDIKNWSSPHTKVKGEVLLKIMSTMQKKYGVRFIICPKAKMGEMIIKLLKGDDKQMKLEVGMYVRTKSGLIAKYIGYQGDKDIEYNRYEFDGKIYWYYEYYNDYVYEEDFKEWFEANVIKASHNIIDLIEVGDYVNGHKVIDDFRMDTDDYGNSFIEIGIESDKFLNHYIRKEDIKSLVTREQFEQMEYNLPNSK